MKRLLCFWPILPLSGPEQFFRGVRNVPEHCSGGGLFGTVRNSQEQSGTAAVKAGSRLKKSDIEYVILRGVSIFLVSRAAKSQLLLSSCALAQRAILQGFLALGK